MDKRIREQLKAIGKELEIDRTEYQGNSHIRVYVVGTDEFITLPTSSSMDATGAARVARDKARQLKRRMK